MPTQDGTLTATFVVRDSNSAVNLITTHAILAIADHPHSEQPLIQRNGRIFKDGADLNGELLVALFTLPPLLLGEVIVILPTARGASRFTVRPTKGRHFVNAYLFIAEVLDCLLESLYLSIALRLTRTWKQISAIRLVSQVNYAPFK